MLVNSPEVIVEETADCLIFIHGKKPPTDAAWNQVAQFWEMHQAAGDVKRYRCAVITEGGGPTPDQRRQQMNRFRDIYKQMPTAVISDSAAIRFVVSSLALLASNIKTFAPKEARQAIEFLEPSGSRQGLLIEGLKRLRQNVQQGTFPTFDALAERLEALH